MAPARELDRGWQLSALGPPVEGAVHWSVWLGLSFLFCERVEFSLKKQTTKEEAGRPSTGCEGHCGPGLVTPEWAALLCFLITVPHMELSLGLSHMEVTRW